MNFYDLNELKHLKTVPVMDELEGVVVLHPRHSRGVLAANREVANHATDNKKRGRADAIANDPFVVITGGLKGAVRVFKIMIEVLP